MQVVSQSVKTKPAILVVVRDYRTCAMYGCIVRFTNCASTNACRHGENSISRTSRALLTCRLQPLHVRLQYMHGERGQWTASVGRPGE
jgi:hypothetical protein